MKPEYEYTGDDSLEVMFHYAKNRNNSLKKMIVNYFELDRLSSEIKLMDFGAGKGEFIDYFKDWPNVSTVAFEIDKTYFENLQRKHRTCFEYSQLKDESIDYIYSFDVLEHIEDDQQALRELFRVLKPGGKIFIYVPAGPALYSRFDKKIGHHRRYKRRELKEKALSAGFTILKAKFHDFLGYFAAYYNKISGKESLDGKMVSIYDRFFFPITNFMEKIIPPPFGKDVMLLMEKAVQNKQ